MYKKTGWMVFMIVSFGTNSEMESNVAQVNAEQGGKTENAGHDQENVEIEQGWTAVLEQEHAREENGANGHGQD